MVINKTLVAKRFGRRASTYDEATPVQAAMASQLVAYAAEYFGPKPELRVLELGCGTGRLTMELLRAFPDARVLGVDIAPDMVACANHRGLAARFVVADAETFVQACDATFDLVVSNAAFQWFQQVGQTLHHIKKLLTPEGLFAASTFGEDTFTELRQAFALAYAECGLDPQPHVVALRPVSRWRVALPQAEFQESRHLREFPDTLSFLRSVQQAGAVNSTHGVRQLSRTLLASMMKHYASHFAKPDGASVAATYHCLSIFCRGKNLPA